MSTEEINTGLELNSSVELNFRTDYLPLNCMAAQAQADRVRKASLDPSAEGGGETQRPAHDAHPAGTPEASGRQEARNAGRQDHCQARRERQEAGGHQRRSCGGQEGDEVGRGPAGASGHKVSCAAPQAHAKPTPSTLATLAP